MVFCIAALVYRAKLLGIFLLSQFVLCRLSRHSVLYVLCQKDCHCMSGLYPILWLYDCSKLSATHCTRPSPPGRIPTSSLFPAAPWAEEALNLNISSYEDVTPNVYVIIQSLIFVSLWYPRQSAEIYVCVNNNTDDEISYHIDVGILIYLTPNISSAVRSD